MGIAQNQVNAEFRVSFIQVKYYVNECIAYLLEFKFF